MSPALLRQPALWIWLALMALAGLIAARSNYVADLSAFLPNSPSAEQRVLVEQLKRGVTARVMLIGIRGGDASARAEASRTLAAALRASGWFEAVHNGENGQDAASSRMGEFLFAHRYLLSPAVTADRFTAEGLREGIADTVSLLGTPAGQLVKPLLWRDPTGETVRMAEAMLPAASPRVDDGVWVSRDQPRALLVATTRAEGADLDGQASAVAAVQRHFEPLAARGLQLELSGPPVFAVNSRSEIQREVERLARWEAAAVIVLLLIAFGSLKALGIALLPVASGVLAGAAAVSLGFGQVHGITLGFGTTLIGEAVDYAVYYLVQARPANAAAGTGHLHWKRHNWPTVRLGVWTSVAGFAALMFSGFGGLAQLGVFSVAGLGAAALTTRYLLPHLAPDGAPGLGLRKALGRTAAWGAARLPRLRWPLAALACLGLAGLIVQPSAWRGNLASLSPVSAKALKLDESLRADLGASEDGALVAIEAPDENTALQRAEQAGARLEALVQQGLLLGYESPAKLLPSVAMQQARQASLPDAGTLRARLAEAAVDGPLPAARLEAFIAEVQAQRQATPITRERLAGTPLESALQAQLLPAHEGGPWTALLTLRLPPSNGGAAAADATRLRTALAGLPETRLVQIQPELNALYGRYLGQAFWQTLLGAAAVLLLLYAHLRSWRRLLRVALPLAASVVLVLAGLTLAGVALGVLHLVGLLLVVAVGSNYALFFDHLRQVGVPGHETLASLLLANLIIVASFGILCTSSVSALLALGQVVAPGTLLSLLLSAAFTTGRSEGAPQGAV